MTRGYCTAAVALCNTSVKYSIGGIAKFCWWENCEEKHMPVSGGTESGIMSTNAQRRVGNDGAGRCLIMWR